MKIQTLPKKPKGQHPRPALIGGNIYKRGPDQFGNVAYYVYAKDDKRLINLDTGTYWRSLNYGTDPYDGDMPWEDVTDRFVLVERESRIELAMAAERRYVWFVSGDSEHLLWLTKEDAERWAREVYPNMDAERRYSRVRFIEVHRYEDK